MFESLHTVDRGFYEIFLGEKFWDRDLRAEPPVLVVPTYKNEDSKFRVVFFKASAEDYTEVPDANYPMLSIQNYTPNLIEEWAEVHRKERLAGFSDKNSSENYTKATVYTAPVPLLFKYDMSGGCKSESDWDGIKQWMFSNFGFRKQKYLTLNKFSLPLIVDEVFGDKVYYNFSWLDIPRSDGIYETVFTFELKAWVKLHQDRDVDLIQELNLNVQVTN